MDQDGMEHFDVANSLMNVNARADGKRNKNAKTLAPDHRLVFQAFDLLTLETFQGLSKGLILQDRQDQLRELYDDIHRLSSPLMGVFHRLPQHQSDAFDNLWEISKDKGWEGIMYRFNGYYAGRKSKDILKRKLVHDHEFEVLQVCNRDMLRPGTTSSVNVCARFRIEYKGCVVWVGSGMSWSQRVEFGAPLSIDICGTCRVGQSTLLGQHVTVAYTEELKSKDGVYSLRFPRLKSVHGRKRKC